MNIPEFIEYAKQNWFNKPSKTTPITAERLNHIEEGIATNNKLLKELIEATTQLNSDKVTLQTGSYGSSVPDSVKIEKAGVYLVYACGIAGSDSAYIHLYRNTVQIQGCQNTQGKSILAITVDNFAINDSVGFRWNNITESSGFRKSYGVVKL